MLSHFVPILFYVSTVDYSLSDMSVTFALSEWSKAVTFDTKKDAVIEELECFPLSISIRNNDPSATTMTSVSLVSNSAMVCIQDTSCE